MFGVAVSNRADRLAFHLAQFQRSIGSVAVIDDPRCVRVVGNPDLQVALGSCSAVGTAHIVSNESAQESPTRQISTVARIIEQRRFDDLRNITGRYTVVVCIPSSREIVAVRDPIGLQPLYYRQTSADLLVGNSVDICGADQPINKAYVARFIAGRGSANTTDTVRDGVVELRPGHWLRWSDGILSSGCYWTPESLPIHQLSFPEAAVRFRDLVADAVRFDIDEPGQTWAHLSGGLDSSSVVSVAVNQPGERAAALGGTITLRDSLANGDDTEFVDTVVDRYRVRNVVLDDWWPWQRDGEGPPVTDRPSRDYPFFSRDRRVARVITQHGGTVLLSGVGPDLYLPQTPTQCSDLIYAGKLATALKQLRGWSVRSRGSLWHNLLTNAVLPLVSPAAPGWLQHGLSRVPGWFTPDFANRFEVRRLMAMSCAWRGRRGAFYQGHIESNLAALSSRISNWLYAPGVDVRHPLMHQPLVEFCYGLPWHSKTDVYWPKPLLRSAMKGILPEKIRSRAGATLLTPRILWAFRHEQDQLQRLVAHSTLAELGCIEPRRVQSALRSLDIFRGGDASFLYALLSMETWLSVKSGRWHRQA